MGEAVRESGLSRSDVFLTTKILSAGGTPEATYKKCLQSVEKIDDGLGKGGNGESKGYVDLFLIHSPHAGTGGRKLMWQALERLKDEGRVKAIGVSNYGIGHIEEMKTYVKVWPPHVNQIEVSFRTSLSKSLFLFRSPYLFVISINWHIQHFGHIVNRLQPTALQWYPGMRWLITYQLHPFCQQREVVDYCNQNKIIVEAYSPIVRNQKAHDPTLTKLAKAHGKTVSQILIRYCLQKGWVPLPKSDTKSRIEENINVYDFELSQDDLSILDGLDQGERGAIVEAVRN